MNFFASVLPYSSYALLAVANTVKDEPDQYEAAMEQLAKMDPSRYFTLAVYCERLKQDDKAAAYMEQGNANDPDSVEKSSYAPWLVNYYLKRGRTEDARKEADMGGEVYS